MCENLEFDLDLKLLFTATGACYESGIYTAIQQIIKSATILSNKYTLFLR